MAETIPAYEVAGMFLRALGAPDTSAMRRAVAIWLRFESGGTITGNNPWNLHSGDACPASKGYCPGNGSLPGQIGNRYAGPGDRNVAVFATLNDGVKASANNLIRLSPNYGYGKVIAEARQGDAVGFLGALQLSSWSAGHYGYRKLVDAFRGSFNYNTPLTLRPVGGGTTGDTGRTVTLPFGSLIRKFNGITGRSLDDGIINAWAVAIADAPDLVKLIMGGDALPTDDAWNEIREQLKASAASYKGKPVEQLPDNITVKLSSNATEARESNDPLTAIANAIGGVGDILGFLLDPQNWVYIFALVGGVALTSYGFSQLTGTRLPRPSLPALDILPDDAATATEEAA